MEKTKLKKVVKTSIIVVVALVVILATGYFAIFLPHKAKIAQQKQVENFATEMRNNLEAQQYKINGLQEYKDEQLRLEEEKIKQEEEAKIASEKESYEQKIRREQGDKNNRIDNCEARKKDCSDRMRADKKLVSENKNDYEEARENYEDDNSSIKQYKKMKVDSYENMLEESEKSLKKTIEDCAGYEKPCE